MARSTFKTLFYINRSKLKKNGKCPIMGRITIDGQQVQYSMGLDINPNNWDTKHGRCKGDTDEMKNINRILTEKEGQIQTKYNELVWQKGYVSAELLKNCLTEDSQSNGMLMEEADRFIEEKKACQNGGTRQAYQSKKINSYICFIILQKVRRAWRQARRDRRSVQSLCHRLRRGI